MIRRASAVDISKLSAVSH